MITRTELIRCLRTLGACSEALDWIEETPGEPAELWVACEHGDWMMWLLVQLGYDERTLRHIACDCAEDWLPIYEAAHPDDPRPRNCIATARKYADGTATYDEMIEACNAAKEAAEAASNADAKYAARVAAWVATCAPAWDPDPARNADWIRARVSWADVEQAIECWTKAELIVRGKKR